MKRIGLIGCGTVAIFGHLPALVSVAGLELVAVCDPNQERLDSVRERFSVPHGYTDAEEFFASDIDAVAVCSPAPCHRQNVLDAARHGKHVLCEKPLALEVCDATEMIDAMRRAGLMLFTGFCYRFSPNALKIKEIIRKGQIGEVRSLRLVFIWDAHGKFDKRDPARGLNQRRASRMLEGGPMFDCGVHQIDLARWWLGSEVVRQSAAGAWVEDYEAPDHIYLHLDHANGAHTMVEMSYSFGHTASEPSPRFGYDIVGTDGLVRYNCESKLFEMRRPDGITTLPYSDQKSFVGMYAAFAEALETGQTGDLPSGSDGLAAVRIARAATDEAISLRNGRD